MRCGRDGLRDRGHPADRPSGADPDLDRPRPARLRRRLGRRGHAGRRLPGGARGARPGEQRRRRRHQELETARSSSRMPNVMPQTTSSCPARPGGRRAPARAAPRPSRSSARARRAAPSRRRRPRPRARARAHRRALRRTPRCGSTRRPSHGRRTRRGRRARARRARSPGRPPRASRAARCAAGRRPAARGGHPAGSCARTRGRAGAWRGAAAARRPDAGRASPTRACPALRSGVRAPGERSLERREVGERPRHARRMADRQIPLLWDATDLAGPLPETGRVRRR